MLYHIENKIHSVIFVGSDKNHIDQRCRNLNLLNLDEPQYFVKPHLLDGVMPHKLKLTPLEKNKLIHIKLPQKKNDKTSILIPDSEIDSCVIDSSVKGRVQEYLTKLKIT